MKNKLDDNIAIAHIKNEFDYQTVEEHCYNTANLAKIIAKKFTDETTNLEQISYIIGLFHDLGKFREEFNYRIRENNKIFTSLKDDGLPSKSHSITGALYTYIKYKDKDYKAFLATVINCHHGYLKNIKRLPNSDSDSIEDDLKNKDYLDKVKDNKLWYNFWDKSDFINIEKSLPFKEDFETWFLTKILLSIQCDADYTDTMNYLSNDNENENINYKSIPELLNLLNSYIKNKESSCNKTDLNKSRNKIKEDCFNAAKYSDEIFSLTVPTGGGKTLSSLVWALNNAIINKKDRIIIVIPYIAIIDQTQKILSDIFGEDNIVIHHSGLDPETESKTNKLLCENWDAPIILTTNVQFFETCFTNRCSKNRKLHNICNSVIIFDEFQTLPTKLIIPSLQILNLINKKYKSNILLCTATQPYFEEIKNFSFSSKEIIQDVDKLFSDLNRTNIIFPNEKISNNQLCEKIINENNSVLTIVNNRKSAQELYWLIKEKEKDKNIYHLSTSMILSHRIKIINEIKEKLKNKQKIIVVSTQLIEAGVDIDFPVVYKAMAGLPSIIQAAGRCNREGLLKSGKVIIFDPKNLCFGELQSEYDSTKLLLQQGKLNNNNLLNCIKEYYIDLYQKSNIDKYGIYELCENLAFEEVDNKYKYIDNNFNQESIIIDFDGKVIESIKKLQKENDTFKISKNLYKKIQLVSINIPRSLFKELKESQTIEEIKPEINIFYLSDLSYYNNEVGLPF